MKKAKVKQVTFLSKLRDPNRFKKLPDDWVRDTMVGVEWGPSSDKYLTFSQAQEYCAKLGGRLPEVNELQSLVDYTKRDPAINKDLFPDTKSSWYWTGTELAGSASSAWCVYFFYGHVLYDSVKGDGGYVRPVRASQFNSLTV